MIRRAHRFSFTTDHGASMSAAWSRARAMHAARSYVVDGPARLSVRPAGIRASRTVGRDRARQGTILVRGLRR
jgi:hypothetical protein